MNLLVGNWWGRRAGCNEFFPTGFCAVGLRCILEVLCGALLHDLHVMKETSLFVIPAFEIVAHQFLPLGPRFREREV